MVGVNRKTVITALSIFLVAVILGSVIFTLQGKEKVTEMQGDTTDVQIPPIDAALPARIETATFALG